MRDGWKEISLEDLETTGVIKLGRGDVISKKDMEADPGPYPVYSSAENKNGMIGTYAKFMFEEELITWSVDGGGHLFYRPKHKFSVTNIGGWLRILDHNIFSYQFLTYALQQLHKQNYFDWQHKAHPSVIRKLYSKIPLPPLPEQKRIVDLISSVDAYIESLEKQLETGKSSRNSILHELLSTPGPGWIETTLGEVAEINPKVESLSPNDYFVPMAAVEAGSRWIKYFEKKGTRGGIRAKSGDVLYARITPCLENGKVSQLQKNVAKCGGSTEFIVLRGTELITSDFLYFWCTLEKTKNKTTSLMTGTTGRQRLAARDFANLELSLPSLPEQKRIVGIITEFDIYIESVEKAIKEGNKLRSGLLSELLSGEHEIPASYDKVMSVA